MSAIFCEMCEKDGFRTRGGAMSAASSYSFKRDTPLRVYHEPECCYFHISSRISERDFDLAVVA